MQPFLPLLTVGLAEVIWMVAGLLAMFTGLSIVVLSLVWLGAQDAGAAAIAAGSTRTGLFGLLQPVADAVKLILKEDVIPSSSERPFSGLLRYCRFVRLYDLGNHSGHRRPGIA